MISPIQTLETAAILATPGPTEPGETVQPLAAVLRRRSRRQRTDHHDASRRFGRVVIPVDPAEYERRRQHAQSVVDGYYGRGRYTVVGTPGEMLEVVKVERVRWMDVA